ncbi:ATP-binding protein [Leucobacter sp. HY1910]
MTNQAQWAPLDIGSRQRWAIVLIQCAIVLVVVIVSAGVAVAVQDHSLRKLAEERVLNAAEGLAKMDRVRDAMQLDFAGASADLQPLADAILQASGFTFVVFANDEGIRLTHPIVSERGKPLSTDHSAVLAGEPFVGVEQGELVPTLRAKTRILVAGEAAGTVSVGVPISDIDEDFHTAVFETLPWIGLAAIMGTLGAAAIATRLNRRLRLLAIQAHSARVRAKLVDGLKEQTHEFRTQLHITQGYLSSGKYAEAEAFLTNLIANASADQDDNDRKRRDASGSKTTHTVRRRSEHDEYLIPASELQGLLDSLSREAVRKGVCLSTGQFPNLITAPRAFSTTVSNLVYNAVEAGAHNIETKWAVGADEITLTVEDDGPGIPAHLRNVVFDSGISTKSTPNGQRRGVGLSLVLQEVVDAGGSIEVGEAALGGARFEVVLPQRRTRD